MNTINNFWGDSLMGQQFETAYNLARGFRKLPIKDESESRQVRINGKLKCGECGESFGEEARVEAGMRCGHCAYPNGD